MDKALEEISIITGGIYANPDVLGDVIYLQAKYFSEDGIWNELVYPDLKMDDKIKRHLLKEGDILFAAKGTKNFAVCIRNKMGKCVASSTFLVLRLREEYKKTILPEFLVWVLNHPHTQAQLKLKAIGTGLPSISKKALESVQIHVPPMTVQQNILIIDELRTKEKRLKKQIGNLREKQIQQLLINLNQEKIVSYGK